MVQNKGLVFKAVPDGYPVAGKDLVVEARDFDIDQTPPSGGITAKVHYISFDPFQRGRMRDPSVKSYSPPYELGKPISNRGIVTVVQSDNSKFKKGQAAVIDHIPTEEYIVVEKEKLEKDGKVLENKYNLDPKIFIGALGMPGLTAYSSLYEIGKPKKGETIFVTAASGAVGALVGELAKREGLKVVGSVGDDDKLEYIKNELGFEGFNYKKEKPVEALKRLAPNGIDIYYDNVSGEQLEAAIINMNTWGRIIACGAISQTSKKPEEQYAIRNMGLFVSKRLKMQGFIVHDENMGPLHAEAHQKNVQAWIHEGSYKPRMSVTQGIDNAAEGFVGMLQGKNFGKTVLEISPM